MDIVHVIPKEGIETAVVFPSKKNVQRNIMRMNDNFPIEVCITIRNLFIIFKVQIVIIYRCTDVFICVIVNAYGKQISVNISKICDLCSNI